MKSALLAVLLAFPWPVVAHGGTTSPSDIPAEKQTKLGLYATPQEAYDAWKLAPETIKILDVRTPEEYIFVGHPEMAWNVPLKLQTYQWDESGKKLPMKDNPDFLAQVKEIFKPADTVYVMCRSGGRSAMAVNALADAGFTKVYNIVDGMEGDLVEDKASPEYGKRMMNGWKNAGLPWTYAVEPAKMKLPVAK